MPRPKKRQPAPAAPAIHNERWPRQLAGAVLGALILWGLGQFGLWPTTEAWALLLWGGAIGALLASSDELVYAGSKLTGRASDTARWRWLNGLLALVALWLLVALLLVVAHLISVALGLTP